VEPLNNELIRMWKEEVVALLAFVYRKWENHDNRQSGFVVSGTVTKLVAVTANSNNEILERSQSKVWH
jgi:hypothetical protein